jgi:hypothetical protein
MKNKRLFTEALLELVCFALLLIFVSTFAITQRHMRLVLRGERPVKSDIQLPPSPGFAVSWALFAPGACSLVALAFIVAYPIAASRAEPPSERLHYPWLFLSNAADYPPASCFTTVIMGMGCTLFAYAFLVRLLEVHKRLPPLDDPVALELLPGVEIPARQLPTLNISATCLGFVAMVALPFAVLAVPIHDAPDVHWSIAAAGFYGSAAYAAMQVALDRASCLPGGWPPSFFTLAMRSHILVFGCSLIATFCVMFGPFGMGGLAGRRPWGIAGDAVCEVVFLGSVLLFISTFYYSGAEMRFSATVELDVDDELLDSARTPLLGRHTVGAAATHGTFGDGCATALK